MSHGETGKLKQDYLKEFADEQEEPENHFYALVENLQTSELSLLFRICIGAEYAFHFDDNNEYFGKCENHPGDGINDLADISEFIMEVDGYSVHFEGPMKIIWDVKNTDRIQLRVDIFKYRRGTWQPTVFNVFRPDLCSVLYSDKEMWYESFSERVEEDSKICVNEKGSLLIFKPSDTHLTFPAVSGVDLAGRHKIVIRLVAFDEENEERPNSICIEMYGEFIKN